MCPHRSTVLAAEDESLPIQIGDAVRFSREHAYSFTGKVLTIDEDRNLAVVLFVDCLGYQRQMTVGCEFLTPAPETATASAVENGEAA